MKKLLLIAGLCVMLSACTSRPEEPDGFYFESVKTTNFNLLSFERNIAPDKMIRIYIEGNGTPNPKRPIALELAKNDSYQNIVYLTRPCQYAPNDDLCDNKIIWTTAQFNQEIIDEMKQAVQSIIKQNRATSVEFVGYDGGATMALLLAPQISQTTKVITIAGILDTDAYTKANNLPKLSESLNPISFKETLSKIPQVHYVGKDDTITTQKMAERFVARLSNPTSVKIKSVANVDHTDWDDVKLDYYK